MLDYNTITLTEALYITLDSGYVNDIVADIIRENVYINNFEQHCYLELLLNRWTLLRESKYDLPKRIIKLKNIVLKSNKGLANKYRYGDWYCIKCGFHSFARNYHCPRCGTIKEITMYTYTG